MDCNIIFSRFFGIEKLVIGERWIGKLDSVSFVIKMHRQVGFSVSHNQNGICKLDLVSIIIKIYRHAGFGVFHHQN
jgi:hypothetical protein